MQFFSLTVLIVLLMTTDANQSSRRRARERRHMRRQIQQILFNKANAGFYRNRVN